MPLPDPSAPQARRRLLAGAAVLAAAGLVVWYGWTTTAGQVRPRVTEYAVESDTALRVEYDLVRPEGTAVTCRVSGLDARRGRVGTVTDEVPAQGPAIVHRAVRVRTSARAVTGVVESCMRLAPR